MAKIYLHVCVRVCVCLRFMNIFPKNIDYVVISTFLYIYDNHYV